MSDPQKNVEVDWNSRWKAPCPKSPYITGLQVNNSMNGGKCAFVPHENNVVNWYGCGPTVYDAAHMGHARNYVSFDILRRIMEGYFGYKVNMCMNITDIDDKIIARSNELQLPFNHVSRFWENDFFAKMKDLGCQLPDVITRVSEYVPEIVRFIQKIVDNGFAYASDGSVYFDTTEFRKCPRHVYGRMEPWSVNDESRVLEGEGSLGHTCEKKCSLDFALWKKSKEGEPSWDSPWGPGRPGWHIECSVMASEVLGFPLDIHSGGIDLRFPHHDNELAQTEAKYDKGQWVNYFLHSGHLHIKGLKMSKSLKNFISIDHILTKYSTRVVRLLVLLHKWDQPMNYDSSEEGSSNTMQEPLEYDRVLLHFCGTMRQILRKTLATSAWSTVKASAQDLENRRSLTNLNSNQKWTEPDRDLFESFGKTQVQIHSALCDNFNTPLVMSKIQEIMGSVNKYLKLQEDQDANSIRGPLLLKIGKYIDYLLKIFGLCESSEENVLSYGVKSTEQNSKFSALMDEIGSFRHCVRESARLLMKNSQEEASRDVARQLLKLSDDFRDENMVEMGIRLEDKGDKGFVWKEGCRDELRAQQLLKKEEEAGKEVEKEARAKAMADARRKKEEISRIPPDCFFKLTRPGEFTDFDDSGVPLKAADGSLVSKGQRDKMKKVLEKHRVAYCQL